MIRIPLRTLYRLADRPLIRRALAALFAASGRRHLAWLDRLAPARAQLRTLLGLVHKARSTPFGRDHDFRRIRSVADFQRLVPLRAPFELARAGPQWQDTRSLRASQRRALGTALALVQEARPRASLLAGELVWLGDDAAGRFPLVLRAGVCTLAELGPRTPALLVGPAERLMEMANQVEAEGGLARKWPGLVGVVSLRRDHHEVGQALRWALGERPALVEVLQLPAGPVAVEDARIGGLRLLPEHGCFFELVPTSECASPQPPRLTPEQARTGDTYELALTSSAGLWACRTGLHLAFDSRGRPRPVPAPAPRVTPGVAVPAAPAPHRPTADTPAARPGTPFRSPWSVPVDRG